MKFHRKSIRLPKYDYSQSGAYFITICTHQREWLFGEILNKKMLLNEFGNIARNEWLETPKIRPNIKLGEFIIMPNHIHGIIWIKDELKGTEHRALTELRSPTYTSGKDVSSEEGEVDRKGVWDGERDRKDTMLRVPTTVPTTAPTIPTTAIESEDTEHRVPTEHRAPTVERFGKPTSNSIPTIIRSFKATTTKQINTIRKLPGFAVWQRNYYEHIIRNEKDLKNITQYIKNNPNNWDKDDLYKL